jgi:hypothetical protein
MIPEGRILIDTAKSFVYAESGLKGVLMASRLSGLSPNLTSRFTPGTLMRFLKHCAEEWPCPLEKEMLRILEELASDGRIKIRRGPNPNAR